MHLLGHMRRHKHKQKILAPGDYVVVVRKVSKDDDTNYLHVSLMLPNNKDYTFHVYFAPNVQEEIVK